MIVEEFDFDSGNITLTMSATQAAVLYSLLQLGIATESVKHLSQILRAALLDVDTRDAYAHLEAIRAGLAEYKEALLPNVDEPLKGVVIQMPKNPLVH